MSKYDNWKQTDEAAEREDLPENWDELTEAEQKEILEFMAMTPAQQRRFSAL